MYAKAKDDLVVYCSHADQDEKETISTHFPKKTFNKNFLNSKNQVSFLGMLCLLTNQQGTIFLMHFLKLLKALFLMR